MTKLTDRTLAGPVRDGASVRVGDHTARRRVVADFVRAGRDEAAVDGHGRDRDDAVPAHRAPALVVHEQDAGVPIVGDRLGEQRAVHVRVAARLQHQRAPEVIEPLHRPRTLVEHRRAFGRWDAVDDQPQRLAGRVRVDGADGVNHVASLWILRRLGVTLNLVRAFYSDHFVLPLPEGHRFPMAKYARLRERVIAEGIVPPRIASAKRRPPAGTT